MSCRFLETLIEENFSTFREVAPLRMIRTREELEETKREERRGEKKREIKKDYKTSCFYIGDVRVFERKRKKK